jgi:hypothetical protein
LRLLIPFDVAGRRGQDPRDWAVRLTVFALVGGIVGGFSSSLSTRVSRLERLTGQVVSAFDVSVIERVRGAALLHGRVSSGADRQTLRTPSNSSEVPQPGSQAGEGGPMYALWNAFAPQSPYSLCWLSWSRLPPWQAQAALPPAVPVSGPS